MDSVMSFALGMKKPGHWFVEIWGEKEILLSTIVKKI